MVEKSQPQGMWPALFDPFFNLGSRIADWLHPASDAASDAAAYHITVELPGVAEADISLDVAGGTLTVSGEKKEEREEKGRDWYFSERQYGRFSRAFRLPEDADEAGIAAAMKDGVLRITVPRGDPPERSRKIEIKRS